MTRPTARVRTTAPGSPATGSPATGSPATASPATASPATGSPVTGSPVTGSPVTASGIAAAGAAFFATLHGHGSHASAYRNGVFVTAAITAVALILTLTDRHRAARVHADQGDYWHHER